MNKRGEPSSIQTHADAIDVDDRDLVARAQKGDHTAFRALFDRYRRRAYALAYGMLRNQDDALDVVQEGFIKAHRHLDKFEGTSSFYTWLYRIVMNLAIDQIRKTKRARQVDFDDAMGHEESELAAGEEGLLPRYLGANPSQSVLRREIREQIDAALQELSPTHREVLLLREVEGLSYEEMATVVGVAKGTIMSRLFHARKNMQKRLAGFMNADKDPEPERD